MGMMGGSRKQAGGKRRRGLHTSRLHNLLVATATVCVIADTLADTDTDQGRVFYSTPDFSITEFDLRMYLRGGPQPAQGEKWGSRERVLQALSDLYAMRTLREDIRDKDLMTDAEKLWLSDYAVTIEGIQRFLDLRVEAMLEATDWEQEAWEHYLSDPTEYKIEESVSVRTLLLEAEQRTQEAAIEMARDLLNKVTEEYSFSDLVIDYNEDKAAALNDGVITGIVRGQTVKPFEDAAFSMRTPGEVSEPVVSQFGVHLIQLIKYQPEYQRDFDEVKSLIVSQLKPRRASQYRAAMQKEARERQPEGYIQHTEALEEIVSETRNGAPMPLPSQ